MPSSWLKGTKPDYTFGHRAINYMAILMVYKPYKYHFFINFTFSGPYLSVFQKVTSIDKFYSANKPSNKRLNTNHPTYQTNIYLHALSLLNISWYSNDNRIILSKNIFT